MSITKKQTILVISNEPDRLEDLSETLQQMGYKLLFAGNAQQGLRLIRRRSPDVVVSELHLPVISGLELCRRIRADKDLQSTPLIFLSDARNIDLNRVEILLVGADDWITASEDAATLEEKIKSVLDRKRLENDLRRFSQRLRNRHYQIAHILKGAIELLTASKFKNGETAPESADQHEFHKKLLEEIEPGTNIIGWMSYLLEEHIKAFSDLAEAGQRKDFAGDQKPEFDNQNTVYESVTYEMINQSLQANRKKISEPLETE